MDKLRAQPAMGEDVCAVCELIFDDPKSVVQCTKCKLYFHPKCELVENRGFHNKRASWRCKKCIATYGEVDHVKKRSRGESASSDVFVSDNSSIEEILSLLQSLVKSNAEIKSKLTEISEENKALKLEIAALRSDKNVGDNNSMSYSAATKTNSNSGGGARQTRNTTRNIKNGRNPRIQLSATGTADSDAAPADQGDNDSEAFVPVPPRKRHIRKPVFVGSLVAEDGGSSVFESVERRQWIYLGRVKAGTSQKLIVDHVKNTWDIDDCLCAPLATYDNICSFKIGVRESHLQKLLDPSKWPKGVAIREFVPLPRNIAANNGRASNSGNFQQVTPAGPME